MMDSILREILESTGVWDWLREQLGGLSETEILAAVQSDFDEVISGLEKRKAP